jgi:hypothetical protein
MKTDSNMKNTINQPFLEHRNKGCVSAIYFPSPVPVFRRKEGSWYDQFRAHMPSYAIAHGTLWPDLMKLIVNVLPVEVILRHYLNVLLTHIFITTFNVKFLILSTLWA